MGSVWVSWRKHSLRVLPNLSEAIGKGKAGIPVVGSTNEHDRLESLADAGCIAYWD